MLKFATLFAAVAAAHTVSELEYQSQFTNFMVKFGKTYEADSLFARYNVFKTNVDHINDVNAKNLSYTLGMNQFGDLTPEEFSKTFASGYKGLKRERNVRDVRNAMRPMASLDWEAKGAVTPVKNQGSCGSCWSFSATGALEGAYQIKYGNLESFSEQELVSCDSSFLGDHGCNGGLMDNAFKWVKSNGGLCSESAYPYVSGTTQQNEDCKPHTSCDNTKLKLSGYTDVKKNSDSALMSALEQQPVSVAIQANQPAFQFYSGGVLTGECGTSLDHGVLAVGYGTWTDGTDYYKVKNSWGPDWGMDGYILIERGASQSGGECGILMGPPSYPNL